MIMNLDTDVFYSFSCDHGTLHHNFLVVSIKSTGVDLFNNMLLFWTIILVLSHFLPGFLFSSFKLSQYFLFLIVTQLHALHNILNRLWILKNVTEATNYPFICKIILILTFSWIFSNILLFQSQNYLFCRKLLHI